MPPLIFTSLSQLIAKCIRAVLLVNSLKPGRVDPCIFSILTTLLPSVSLGWLISSVSLTTSTISSKLTFLPPGFYSIISSLLHHQTNLLQIFIYHVTLLLRNPIKPLFFVFYCSKFKLFMLSSYIIMASKLISLSSYSTIHHILAKWLSSHSPYESGTVPYLHPIYLSYCIKYLPLFSLLRY